MLSVKPINYSDINSADLALIANKLIFHSKEWLRLLEATQSASLMLIGFYSNNKLVGVAPIFCRRFAVFKIAASPMIIEDTPYMAIAIDDDLFSDAIFALDRYLTSRHFSFIRLIFSKDVSAMPLPGGFNVINKHSHVLRITDIDTIWRNLEGRCRTAIRKAEKSGVSVSIETDASFMDTYYDMCSLLYRRQKMSVRNSKLFYNKLFADLGDNLLVISAHLNQHCIAAAIILVAPPRAYYLDGVSLQDYNAYSPNNLIQWKAIQLALEKGCMEYDFVGSDIPRLANFKKSFGGTLTTYTCLEKSNSAIATLARSQYNAFKIRFGALKLIFCRHYTQRPK
jgi:lipid II:glycine glycyltransferase (peptidoglycan interpeptide bridge formation enzyme)